MPDYQAEIDASFAQGSIGRAKDAATSEEFSAMTENALKILKYVNKDFASVFVYHPTSCCNMSNFIFS